MYRFRQNRLKSPKDLYLNFQEYYLMKPQLTDDIVLQMIQGIIKNFY